MWIVLLSLLTRLPVAAAGGGQSPSLDAQSLDGEFQAAVSQYDSRQYAEAAVRLERILRQVPESFETHELLGLVYSAQSEDAKANPHLEKAVRLKPDSAAARSNLAANFMRKLRRFSSKPSESILLLTTTVTIWRWLIFLPGGRPTPGNWSTIS